MSNFNWTLKTFRKGRFCIGLMGSYEILCFDYYEQQELLTRLLLKAGDMLIIIGQPEREKHQKMSIYSITEKAEGLFVV
mgnify:CR=1 FL=1